MEWYEIAMAADVGVRRKVGSLQRGREDHGFGPSDWNVDIMGAIAECACAKALNRYWDGSVDTFKQGDVGKAQVRWVENENLCLIVRPADSGDDFFVLVTGKVPTLNVVGYIKGSVAMRDEWRRSPNNQPPAYFVPQSALTAIGGKL